MSVPNTTLTLIPTLILTLTLVLPGSSITLTHVTLTPHTWPNLPTQTTRPTTDPYRHQPSLTNTNLHLDTNWHLQIPTKETPFQILNERSHTSSGLKPSVRCSAMWQLLLLLSCKCLCLLCFGCLHMCMSFSRCLKFDSLGELCHPLSGQAGHWCCKVISDHRFFNKRTGYRC